MPGTPAVPDHPYRTAIATVCLSGTLEEKVAAAAGAGFDGVEIFEPDLVATPWRPAEIRARCADLGLSIDLYQPFRDFEAVSPAQHRANLRRAELKFDVMEELGTGTMLACSSVSPDALDDDDLAAEQLHALAARAAERGLRIAYEALAWGRHVSTWDHSWRIVERGDHPALGLCLDSFHVLSRRSPIEAIADLPPGKVFFLQLADAPSMDMDVLQWSRHHRLFPGQGAFDLPAFLGAVLRSGYDGPLSLEVFNDVFRQSDPVHTAVDALRSLLVLQEDLARSGDLDPARRERLPCPPAAPALTGYAFGELGVDNDAGRMLGDVLTALGFTHTGQHRSQPAQLWRQGRASIVLNWGSGRPPGPASAPGTARIAAVGVESTDVPTSVDRAEALLAPILPRGAGGAENELLAVAAPDGTSVCFCGSGENLSWTDDFLPTDAPAVDSVGLDRIDHVALTQPFDAFTEAALFYRSVLGLAGQTPQEFAAPMGLQRSRAMKTADGAIRIPLSASVLRGTASEGPGAAQHIAFSCPDIFATAAALRKSQAPLLVVPDNYYADLDARLDLDPGLLAALQEYNVLYDADADGEFFQLYTEVLGNRVFFEVVQRSGRYDGYGVVNTPVHMAAHHRRARRRNPL